MSQTQTPDRPIWPTVPETITPPEPKAGEAEAPEQDASAGERRAPAASRPGGFEGFGSLAG